MAYYLQMDGIDDYIKTPSMTFTRVVMDFKARQPAATAKTYIDFRAGFSFGYVQRTTGNVDTIGNTGAMTVKVNNSTVTNNTAFIPYDTRCTLDVTWSAAGTDDANIFSTSANVQPMTGDIYDVAFYNGATLVAHYDMTLGNVQDQSGNVRHATLTGGTWVSDATGTTHNGAASITGVSTITASATVIPAAITGSASLQGVATVSATADVVNAPMLGSASLQGIGTATATASVIRSGSANIMGVSTLTASAAGLTVLGGASLTGVGWVMCSAIEGQFIVSVVNLNGVQSFVIALQGNKEQTVQVLGLKDNIVLLEGEI